MYTYSALSVHHEGALIGPAYGSSYLLAKTEITATETQIEEDLYVQGLEWLEQQGADVVSSSLGYIDWYTYAQLDGNTAVTTRAARIATRKGVLLVTAMGNENWYQSGNSGPTGTLIAPADADSIIAEPVSVPSLTAAQASALEIYDTTLRDGAQAEDVSFSVEDKLRVAQRLDELGVHFIEGGWPGANPKDIEFFRTVKTIPFKNATIVAFGSTRKASNSVRKDKNLQELLASGTPTITLFGKSWSFQVTDALGIALAKNLELIEDSIHYLRSKDRRVFCDAEHFFDGYKANPDYALQTIRRAIAGGAERVILCDTNGGTMPWEIREICRIVKQECPVPLGIHAHNDSEMAVANSLA